MDNKKIWAIDLVMIVGTLLVLITLIGYSTPRVISPIEINATSSDVLFSIAKTDHLYIDTNENFTTKNQYLLKDGLILELEPGVYYFKTVKEELSEIKKVTLNSKFTLELKENHDHFDVVNAGVTPIAVSVYDKDSLVYETELAPNKNKFFGGLK